MNEQLEKEKYFIVRDFVSKEILELCAYYYEIKFLVKKDFVNSVGKFTEGNPDVVQPCSIYSYGDAFTESLMALYLPAIKEITGIDTLEPTYSFTRFYEKGQWLVRHSDRASCQYSITLPLVSYDSTPWIIHMEGHEIDLKLGDLVIYKGCEAKHWREPYQGEAQVQAHLHYVDIATEAYRPYVLDGRSRLGEKHPNTIGQE